MVCPCCTKEQFLESHLLKKGLAVFLRRFYYRDVVAVVFMLQLQTSSPFGETSFQTCCTSNYSIFIPKAQEEKLGRPNCPPPPPLKKKKETSHKQQPTHQTVMTVQLLEPKSAKSCRKCNNKSS